MPSVNELLQDEVLRHRVMLSRYENGVIRKMLGILNRADSSIFADLAERLDAMSGASFSMERLQSMLFSIRVLTSTAVDSISRVLVGDLKALTDYEAAYQSKILDIFTPFKVHIAAVDTAQVYAAAMAQPFQGTLLKPALEDVGVRRLGKIQQTVAQGFVEGRTNAQVITQLRGTRAAGYADGLMQQSRRDVAAIVQTAAAHTAAFARDAVMTANSDLIKAIRWSATPDNRTTEICRLRDGLLYDPDTHEGIDHAIPWLGGPGNAHWNCRSAAIPVMKSNEELGFDVPELDIKGTRASMDGQVPRETTYMDWITKQSAARQDDILGPTRGALLRSGGLNPRDMYDAKGNWLTLEELRAKDEAAFTRAGM